jgi:hypothetical protein
VVLSPWLGFWWVLIAVGSACLYRRRIAGNGVERRIIFGHGRGRETISGCARGKYQVASAGEFHRAGSRRWSLATSHRH